MVTWHTKQKTILDEKARNVKNVNILNSFKDLEKFFIAE